MIVVVGVVLGVGVGLGCGGMIVVVVGVEFWRILLEWSAEQGELDAKSGGVYCRR
ncbi:hypothetical protein Pmar_PMAR028211 [Perkinsus marinus ATCC 50983]|uniref:Transmembrane protein n=1 Tax=Perkinsus marinus (strain ATCC 50983 / TXsc) TaxID=423536 RepID=C5LB95_PERM5|nr:hypothetical protein Pmar_PMAR028211 [Perkinsus marinus ATCC 50983]EER06023.1 hypothetical protein Pmar_PMAR028211 [Perkinsus marinus ATCC 50983]|eukprot:XP_002774207.1 hypothetical protein Pmar_PMAR028211 [Perkinsus marinus ATCC 50983]